MQVVSEKCGTCKSDDSTVTRICEYSKAVEPQEILIKDMHENHDDQRNENITTETELLRETARVKIEKRSSMLNTSSNFNEQ